MYYTITICSEEEDAIIGFDGCGMFEVKTLDVILTECPNLRILGYSGYGEEKLDVSKNPLLEFIDFHEIRNEKLDFSANPLLEELHIEGAKDLVSLNLSKNDKLRRLDIFMCHNLQQRKYRRWPPPLIRYPAPLQAQRYGRFGARAL